MPTLNYIFFLSYLLTVLAATLAGLRRMDRMDRPLRLILLLLILILVNESLGLYSKINWGTKAALSHVFSIPELALVNLYFLYTCFRRPARAAIITALLLPVALAGANMLWLQPIQVYNSNMLMAQSILIIAMALYALYRMMRSDHLLHITAYPHFRIWVILLVLWTSTIFFWPMFDLLSNTRFFIPIGYVQSVLNILIYGGIGLTFYQLPPRPASRSEPQLL